MTKTLFTSICTAILAVGIVYADEPKLPEGKKAVVV